VLSQNALHLGKPPNRPKADNVDRDIELATRVALRIKGGTMRKTALSELAEESPHSKGAVEAAYDKYKKYTDSIIDSGPVVLRSVGINVNEDVRMAALVCLEQTAGRELPAAIDAVSEALSKKREIVEAAYLTFGKYAWGFVKEKPDSLWLLGIELKQSIE
jgi:hypothetical protein